MATFFTDFSGYSDGAVSSVLAGDFSEQQTTTNWQRTVASGVSGATGSGEKVMRFARTTGGTGINCVVLDDIAGTTGDIEVYGRWRMTSVPDVGYVQGPVLVDATGACYGMAWGDTNSDPGRYSAGGTKSADIGSDISAGIDAGVFLHYRIGRSGTTIRFKAWTGAIGDEPGSWETSGTDSTLTTLKAGFISHEYQWAPYELDLFGVGTAGDAAPTSAPSSETTVTPDPASLTLNGRTPSTSVFSNVRIRQVLVSESGAVAGDRTDITVLVWYSGTPTGAPDVSLGGQTTQPAGTTSWSIATGGLAYNDAIFMLAYSGSPPDTYTCGRLVPNYE